MPIDVYVLDTGDRVMSMRGAVKAMTGKDAGNPGEYLSVQSLKGFIDKDLVLVETGCAARSGIMPDKSSNE